MEAGFTSPRAGGGGAAGDSLGAREAAGDQQQQGRLGRALVVLPAEAMLAVLSFCSTRALQGSLLMVSPRALIQQLKTDRGNTLLWPENLLDQCEAAVGMKISDVFFSSQGNRVAVLFRGCEKMEVWDRRVGLLREITFPRCRTAQFSPSGDCLLLCQTLPGDVGGTARLVDLRQAATRRVPFQHSPLGAGEASSNFSSWLGERSVCMSKTDMSRGRAWVCRTADGNGLGIDGDGEAMHSSYVEDGVISGLAFQEEESVIGQGQCPTTEQLASLGWHSSWAVHYRGPRDLDIACHKESDRRGDCTVASVADPRPTAPSSRIREGGKVWVYSIRNGVMSTAVRHGNHAVRCKIIREVPSLCFSPDGKTLAAWNARWLFLCRLAGSGEWLPAKVLEMDEGMICFRVVFPVTGREIVLLECGPVQQRGDGGRERERGSRPGGRTGDARFRHVLWNYGATAQPWGSRFNATMPHGSDFLRGQGSTQHPLWDRSVWVALVGFSGGLEGGAEGGGGGAARASGETEWEAWCRAQRTVSRW